MVLKYPERLTETEKRHFSSLFPQCWLCKCEVALWANNDITLQTADSVTMCCNNLTVLRNRSDSAVFRPTWWNCPPFVWTVHGEAAGQPLLKAVGGCMLKQQSTGCGRRLFDICLDYFRWRIRQVLYETCPEALASFPSVKETIRTQGYPPLVCAVLLRVPSCEKSFSCHCCWRELWDLVFHFSRYVHSSRRRRRPRPSPNRCWSQSCDGDISLRCSWTLQSLHKQPERSRQIKAKLNLNKCICSFKHVKVWSCMEV